MTNLDRFKQGLLGTAPDSEITEALKAEFGDDRHRVMSWLSAQASISRRYNKVVRWVTFGGGLFLGLAIAMIVRVLS